MTEKEKMIKGELYLPFDEELFNERQYAKEIIFKYNSLEPKAVEERNELLKELFGSIEKGFFIEPPFRCDYGYNIHWGENSYANYNCTILDCAEVKIGKNVLIGPNVNIFTVGHPIDTELRVKGFEYAYPIEIGDNVWIGGGVTINPGVKIGANTIIGSGSVVTKDIRSGVIAVGNPCKVIKEIKNK